MSACLTSTKLTIAEQTHSNRKITTAGYRPLPLKMAPSLLADQIERPGDFIFMTGIDHACIETAYFHSSPERIGAPCTDRIQINLDGADLSGCDLSNVDLSGVTAKGASLLRTSLIGTQLWAHPDDPHCQNLNVASSRS